MYLSITTVDSLGSDGIFILMVSVSFISMTPFEQIFRRYEACSTVLRVFENSFSLKTKRLSTAIAGTLLGRSPKISSRRQKTDNCYSEILDIKLAQSVIQYEIK